MSSSLLQIDSGYSLPPIEPVIHKDFAELYIPYYDEELDVPQGETHFETVYNQLYLIGHMAEKAGYKLLSDCPVCYWEKVNTKKKVYLPDITILKSKNPAAAVFQEVVLVGEIVSGTSRAKMEKDTVKMFQLNELHGIPEFLLIYPDPQDDRILDWFVLSGGKYRKLIPQKGRYERHSSIG
ncbi:MAG: Uma2 family endonuclease [Acidobacteriota bacterium]|nr:Uma2 family endonuclease [Acidobacteriota bacterium]